MPKKHASCTALPTYNMYMADIDTQKHTETHGNTKPDRTRQRQAETDRERQRHDCSALSFVWLHHCPYPISKNQTYLCRSFVDSSSSSLSLCIANMMNIASCRFCRSRLVRRQTDRCHMAQKLVQRGVLLTEHQQKDWQ